MAQELAHVYVFRRGRHCKIGVAKDIEARMAQLKNGSGERLRLIAFTALIPRSLAFSYEAQAHKRLATFRAEGQREWFAVNPQVAEAALLHVINADRGRYDAEARLSYLAHLTAESASSAPV